MGKRKERDAKTGRNGESETERDGEKKQRETEKLKKTERRKNGEKRRGRDRKTEKKKRRESQLLYSRGPNMGERLHLVQCASLPIQVLLTSQYPLPQVINKVPL